jgi:hypothetical protein
MWLRGGRCLEDSGVEPFGKKKKKDAHLRKCHPCAVHVVPANGTVWCRCVVAASCGVVVWLHRVVVTPCGVVLCRAWCPSSCCRHIKREGALLRGAGQCVRWHSGGRRTQIRVNCKHGKKERKKKKTQLAVEVLWGDEWDARGGCMYILHKGGARVRVRVGAQR